jgi:hypothetical protein
MKIFKLKVYLSAYVNMCIKNQKKIIIYFLLNKLFIIILIILSLANYFILGF